MWSLTARLVAQQRHHKEDVIVGALIGIGCATTCYLIYWRSPLTPHHLIQDRSVTRARVVYTDDEAIGGTNSYNYELADAEHVHDLESV